MDVAQIVAVWLHVVAFVIAWGYYGILGRIVLPGLERSLDRPVLVAASLMAIERRALPLIALSLVLFMVTGSYLLLIDPEYAGLGNFSSSWATLMLVKHLVIGALIVLGVIVDGLIRGLADAADDLERQTGIRRVRLCAEGATAVGALIALLTAAAEVGV